MATVLQGEASHDVDGGPEFAEVFVIVWIGAMVVTLNSKLLGGHMLVNIEIIPNRLDFVTILLGFQFLLSVCLRSRILSDSSRCRFGYLSSHPSGSADHCAVLLAARNHLSRFPLGHLW